MLSKTGYWILKSPFSSIILFILIFNNTNISAKIVFTGFMQNGDLVYTKSGKTNGTFLYDFTVFEKISEHCFEKIIPSGTEPNLFVVEKQNIIYLWNRSQDSLHKIIIGKSPSLLHKEDYEKGFIYINEKRQLSVYDKEYFNSQENEKNRKKFKINNSLSQVEYHEKSDSLYFIAQINNEKHLFRKDFSFNKLTRLKRCDKFTIADKQDKIGFVDRNTIGFIDLKGEPILLYLPYYEKTPIRHEFKNKIIESNIQFSPNGEYVLFALSGDLTKLFLYSTHLPAPILIDEISITRNDFIMTEQIPMNVLNLREKLIKEKNRYIQIPLSLMPEFEKIPSPDNALVINQGVRLRESPSEKNSRILKIMSLWENVTIIKKGNRATINEHTNNWYQVKTRNNIKGWIFGRFLLHQNHQLDLDKNSKEEKAGFFYTENDVFFYLENDKIYRKKLFQIKEYEKIYKQNIYYLDLNQDYRKEALCLHYITSHNKLNIRVNILSFDGKSFKILLIKQIPLSSLIDPVTIFFQKDNSQKNYTIIFKQDDRVLNRSSLH